MIFRDKMRTESRPMREGEQYFEFYDSSARDDIVLKRKTLNLWASRLPVGEQQSIRSRMKSSTREFQAAELELAVHEILHRLDFEIQVHPATPKGRRPDFLAVRSESRTFIEVTAIVESDEDYARDMRLAPIVNALNAMPLPPGHFFMFSVESYGSKSPSVRLVYAKVQSWVAEHAPLQANDPIETIVAQEDWQFELTLMNTGSAKVYDRAIGGQSGGASWASPALDLKSKLESKSSRYGPLDAAFVIAVGDFRLLGIDEEEGVSEALFGQWATQIGRNTLETTNVFRPNGFFGHERGPQHSWVSGVLIVPGRPYWATQTTGKKPVIYLNPFALHPISAEHFGFESRSLSDQGKLLSNAGPDMKQLLGVG